MDLKLPFEVAYQAQSMMDFKFNYPPDSFWIARTKATKIERTSKGGREIQNVTKPHAVDLEGLKAALIEGPAEFDEFDATTVIKAVMRIEVGLIDRPEANVFRINAVVFGDEEVFVDLKSPSRKQVETTRAASSSSYSTNGGTTTLLDVAPVIKLFRELLVGSAGYPNGIPVPHMDVYIQALYGEIDPNG